MVFLNFGIKDLNKLFSEVEISGGIIFILGTPDSGYEIFAKSILLSTDGYKRVAFLGKESKQEFLKSISMYNLGDPQSVEVLELERYMFKRILVGIEKISELISTGDLTSLLDLGSNSQEAEALGYDFMTFFVTKIYDYFNTKLLIDFIDILGDEYPATDVFRVLSAMMVLSKMKNNFFILTMEEGINQELEKKIISQSDIVFKLYSEKRSLDERIRFIELLKIKNYPHLHFYATYSIAKNEGFRIEHVKRI